MIMYNINLICPCAYKSIGLLPLQIRGMRVKLWYLIVSYSGVFLPLELLLLWCSPRDFFICGVGPGPHSICPSDCRPWNLCIRVGGGGECLGLKVIPFCLLQQSVVHGTSRSGE